MLKGLKKKNYDEIGVFNSLPIRGKDFILDNIIKENRENLVDIQIEMETIMLNGDREKAKLNVLRGMYYFILFIYIYYL
jgi:hypothetical protein